MRKTLRLFFLLDALLAAGLALGGYYLWLLNTQLAALATLFIVVGSFRGYRTLVQKRAETHPVDDAQEELDRYDDRYELFDDREDASGDDPKVILAREKEQNRLRFADTLQTFGGAVSLWRLLGYGLLIAAFFWLRSHGWFHPWAFLAGITLVPAGVLLSFVLQPSGSGDKRVGDQTL